MNEAIQAKIEKAFNDRVAAFTAHTGKKLKPRSKQFQDKQAEFYSGAMTALIAVFNEDLEDIDIIYKKASEGKGGFENNINGMAMTPAWVFGIFRGDDLYEEGIKIREQRLQNKIKKETETTQQ